MDNKLNKQEMFLNNEKLIYFTMKKYFPQLYYNLDNREDYYQIGAIGLLKAIDNYNSNVASFSTYAIPVIWGEMKRTLRDDSRNIHYGRKIVDVANNLMKLYNETNNSEDDYVVFLNKQLSTLDISTDEKFGVINYYLDTMSLDDIVYDKNDSNKITVADTIPDETNIDDIAIKNNYISNVNNQLTKNEREVLIYLLNDETQRNIANKCNLSQPQISRIERKIKVLFIKELCHAEQYDLALRLLCKLCNNKNILEFCLKHRINIPNITNKLEKRELNMNENLQKDYSKESCHDLIVKCVIKLLLQKRNMNNNTFKNSIIYLLNKSNLKNKSVNNYLNNLNKSEMDNIIDEAKQNIIKFNYRYDYEIKIDECMLELSKFNEIEKHITNPINMKHKSNSEKSPLEDNTNDDTFINIYKLLETFKRDNMLLKFQL